MNQLYLGVAAALALCTCLPVRAQEPVAVVEETVFDGDYLSIGIGGGYSPSYLGSDDYVISALPIIQGSYRGIDINPRGAGLAIDFIDDGAGGGVGFDLGIVGRLRSDRASQIEDDVIESLGELDRAIEVGPTAGVSVTQVLNPYDSLTLGGDVAWDVNGAHGGMVVSPSVTYFTPLSRALAASLSLSAEYGDDEFMDYYFRVTPAQSATTGGELPAFEPDGGGFTSAGATLLFAFDLNGDLTDGGWGLLAIGGYSRVLGDAKNSPYTSIRGAADQLFGALGIGYTF